MRQFTLLLGGWLLSVATFAGASTIEEANNQFGFQSVSTSVDYTETGNGQLGSRTGILDTETGSVPGTGRYFSLMDDFLFGNDYVKLTYDNVIGQTKYIGGALPNGVYGSIVSSSSAVLTNYSLCYGKGVELESSSMLTPYVEIGYHLWERGVNYGETYTHQYSGFGLMYQNSPIDNLVLAVNAMYGQTSQANIVVNSGAGLTGFAGSLGSSSFTQLGLAVDYAFGKILHLNAGVDYSSFAYGISANYPSGNLISWEPDSATHYTTVRVGLGWGF